ncbi:hypothetical protein GCK32_020508 [Trichostrongylus colubriformis]|uniref:Uncharacterized protein n=1 Tax=Trichostrongylus colubriformis TaxID=6319 RepID=A0AAN8FKZ6_TRICO
MKVNVKEKRDKNKKHIIKDEKVESIEMRGVENKSTLKPITKQQDAESEVREIAKRKKFTFCCLAVWAMVLIASEKTPSCPPFHPTACCELLHASVASYVTAALQVGTLVIYF